VAESPLSFPTYPHPRADKLCRFLYLHGYSFYRILNGKRRKLQHDRLFDVSKAYLTDICETLKDVEIDVDGVSDRRDKDYVIDWKGDISKARQIPDTCLNIAALLYDNILHSFMEENDMEATESLLLRIRSSNISLVDFKFMNRQLRIPTFNSSESKLESAMFTFSSDYKLYNYAIEEKN